MFWAIIEELHYRTDVCCPNANMLKRPIWCFTVCCRFFLLQVTLVCVFTFGLTVLTKLDLLVNNGISLVLGKMRNCVMQNTNGRMRNEKMQNNGDWSTRQTTWLQQLQSWPRSSVRCWHWIHRCYAQILLVSVVFAMVLHLSVVGLFVFCCHKRYSTEVDDRSPPFYIEARQNNAFCINTNR